MPAYTKQLPKHWNGNVVILTKFSSVAALEVVILTTFSAASDENFIKMKTFPFQLNSTGLSISIHWGDVRRHAIIRTRQTLVKFKSKYNKFHSRMSFENVKKTTILAEPKCVNLINSTHIKHFPVVKYFRHYSWLYYWTHWGPVTPLLVQSMDFSLFGA